MGTLHGVGAPCLEDQSARRCMERVTGIGGLFFRARDPAALSRWYQEHLGITLTPSTYDDVPWRQEAGPRAIRSSYGSRRGATSRVPPDKRLNLTARAGSDDAFR